MPKETRAEQEAEADSKTVIVLFCTEIYVSPLDLFIASQIRDQTHLASRSRVQIATFSFLHFWFGNKRADGGERN